MFVVFFNDTASTEIYTLSLHDALPICRRCETVLVHRQEGDLDAVQIAEAEMAGQRVLGEHQRDQDRKSTRLNSSHANISYSAFCFNKKNFASILCSRSIHPSSFQSTPP